MTREDRVRLKWETLRSFLRLSSPEKLVEVFLLQAEDTEAWEILREILLLMRHRLPATEAFDAQKLALDRLYLLTRFVETYERFPNPEEEGLLFQQGSGLVTVSDLLRKKMSSVRERFLRRLDLKRKWRGSIGIGIDEVPRGDPLPEDERDRTDVP